MPSGVYKHKKPKTEKQLEASRQNIKLAHINRKPPTKKQLEALDRGRRLPRTKKQREAHVTADSIVKHHNDLCDGKLRPDDITYMTHSEHASLHNALRAAAYRMMKNKLLGY